MTICCNFSSKRYSAKPKNVGAVQNELVHPVDVEVSELATSLGKGANCRAAAVNGKGDQGFISQQLFLIDFDNEDAKKNPLPADERMCPSKALQIANDAGLKPSFMYMTHSSTAELVKFRLAFVTDRAIEDIVDRGRIQSYLMSLFPTCDQKCSNPARLFFGGHSGLCYTDFETENSADELLSRTISRPRQKKRQGQQAWKKDVFKGRSNVDMIRERDIEGLKARIMPEPQIFETKKDLMMHVYRLDLAELLDVVPRKSFRCLFHNDRNPSASVFQEPHGTWRYVCHSEKCGVNWNIKQVVEALGNFTSEYEALRFIKAVYALDVRETEWSREQNENIDFILAALSGVSEASFSELCPTASKTTRYAKETFISILCHAKSTIYP